MAPGDPLGSTVGAVAPLKPSRPLIGAAAVMWLIIFSPWTAGWINFWLQSVVAIGVLAGLALWIDRGTLRAVYSFKPSYLLWGIGSAVALYAIFWVGDKVSRFVFENAQAQIESIYASGQGVAPGMLALLLAVCIGPGEEIFWRGHVQRWLATKHGDLGGLFIATAIYALIHVWSFNLMLVGAAMVGGLFWGILYMHCKSVWPVMISHGLWDVAIFVVWPIA